MNQMPYHFANDMCMVCHGYYKNHLFHPRDSLFTASIRSHKANDPYPMIQYHDHQASIPPGDSNPENVPAPPRKTPPYSSRKPTPTRRPASKANKEPVVVKVATNPTRSSSRVRKRKADILESASSVKNTKIVTVEKEQVTKICNKEIMRNRESTKARKAAIKKKEVDDEEEQVRAFRLEEAKEKKKRQRIRRLATQEVSRCIRNIYCIYKLCIVNVVKYVVYT